MNIYLKAKVQEIAISGCKLEYKGSLTLDEDIMDKLDVSDGEQVYINSKSGKSRIMTYIIPGERGSRICEANGGASWYFTKGEIVHLLFFALSEKPIKPIIL